MPVPAHRRSSTRGKTNRAHQALKKTKPVKCSNCGKPKMAHRVCLNCGMYKGKQIVKAKTKKTKKS